MTEPITISSNDFRVVSTCPSGCKKTSSYEVAVGGASRYRFTLGEVLSQSLDLDVCVDNGWTRIKLKDVPNFIVDAFETIKNEGMDIDGIFRKEGNSARLNRAEVQNVYSGQSNIPTDFTVIDVCTMVKRFLRDLKPTLLDSPDFRDRLLRKGAQAKIENNHVLTHMEVASLFECKPLLSAPHLGTLAYLMRMLVRIADHSDRHKMTVDNLSLVLVGSVFGDFMGTLNGIGGSGNESRSKKSARKSSQEELLSKKYDMDVQVSAVKLLIVNANRIGLPLRFYVTSNGQTMQPNYVRSTSAMPTIRFEPSGNDDMGFSSDFNDPQTSSGLSKKTASMSTRDSRAALMRRDSDATHVAVSKMKSERGLGMFQKRSSSILPTFRDFRQRVSNHILKRNKSPSPVRSGLSTSSKSEWKTPYRLESATSSSGTAPDSPIDSCKNDVFAADPFEEATPQKEPLRNGTRGVVDVSPETVKTSSPSSPSEKTVVKMRQRNTPTRNESKCGSIGSTSSGRQSRSQFPRLGNTNSVRRNTPSDPTSQQNQLMMQQIMQVVSNSTTGGGGQLPLRRMTQNEQNGGEQLRMLKRRESEERSLKSAGGNSTNTLNDENESPSLRKKKKKTLLGEIASEENSKKSKVPRRHTTPIKNGSELRLGRHNNKIAPQRRATEWQFAFGEEKENMLQRGVIEEELLLRMSNGDDTMNTRNMERVNGGEESMESTLFEFDKSEMSRTILEQRDIEHRSRRLQRRNRRKQSNTSLKVFNGSYVDTAFEITSGKKMSGQVGGTGGEAKKDENEETKKLENAVWDEWKEADETMDVKIQSTVLSSPRLAMPQQPTMVNYLLASRSSSSWPTPPGMPMGGDNEISKRSDLLLDITKLASPAAQRRRNGPAKVCDMATSPFVFAKDDELLAVSASVQAIPSTPPNVKTPKLARPQAMAQLKKLDSIGVKPTNQHENGLAWVGERQLVVSSPQPPRRRVAQSVGGDSRPTSSQSTRRSDVGDGTLSMRRVGQSPLATGEKFSNGAPNSPFLSARQSSAFASIPSTPNISRPTSRVSLSPVLRNVASRASQRSSHLSPLIASPLSANYALSLATPPRTRRHRSPTPGSTKISSNARKDHYSTENENENEFIPIPSIDTVHSLMLTSPMRKGFSTSNMSNRMSFADVMESEMAGVNTPQPCESSPKAQTSDESTAAPTSTSRPNRPILMPQFSLDSAIAARQSLSPSMTRRPEETNYLSRLRSTSVAMESTVKTPRMVRKTDGKEDGMFKCPLLPPMKSHENVDKSKTGEKPNRRRDASATGITSSSTGTSSRPISRASMSSGRGNRMSATDEEDFGFGEYTDILRTATNDSCLPTRHQNLESRPSVALLRHSQSGLVRSRVHQFQEIEQLSRGVNDSLASGRVSAMSQSSVRSSDTLFSDSSNEVGGVRGGGSTVTDSSATPTSSNHCL